MNEPTKPDNDDDRRREMMNRPGQLVIPAWTAAISVVLSFLAGSSILVTELLGQGRISVLALGAWLITLPIVAFDPIQAIRVAIQESIGNRRRP